MTGSSSTGDPKTGRTRHRGRSLLGLFIACTLALGDAFAAPGPVAPLVTSGPCDPQLGVLFPDLTCREFAVVGQAPIGVWVAAGSALAEPVVGPNGTDLKLGRVVVVKDVLMDLSYVPDTHRFVLSGGPYPSRLISSFGPKPAGRILVVPGAGTLLTVDDRHGAEERGRYRIDDGVVTSISSDLQWVGVSGPVRDLVEVYRANDFMIPLVSVKKGQTLTVLVVDESHLFGLHETEYLKDAAGNPDKTRPYLRCLVRTEFGLVGWARIELASGGKPAMVDGLE